MPSLKLIGISIVLAIIAGLSSATWFEHQKYLTTKAQYEGFVAKAQALAAQQLAENARKEKEHAQILQDALAARDAAFSSLRHYADLARSGRLSITPIASPGTDRLCFSRPAFDAALQQFLGTTEGLITEGDGSVIDNQAWAQAWPK